eukprot:TRINITY_DN981_c0_g2_i1.p1 TRINITY_DN981_c0_g2~~TRINITY_DN981_c0_g2_i1.p1  ORF type:complete len:203 (-),score=24.14 TRINITY_DN981_c0_g2_i1:54-662(-)
MRFPPQDFSRRNSVRPYDSLVPGSIPPSIKMPVVKNKKSAKVSESKVNTSMIFNGRSDINSWLPEYDPVEVDSNENASSYKELKAHMNEILTKEGKRRDHNKYWESCLLCYINPLGNTAANFSIHYINSKTKTESKLIQAFLTAVGNVYKCLEDIVLQISSRELHRANKTNAYNCLRLKDFTKLKKLPKRLFSEINIFNPHL